MNLTYFFFAQKYSEDHKRKVREAAEEKTVEKSGEKTDTKPAAAAPAPKPAIRPKDGEVVDEDKYFILNDNGHALIKIYEFNIGEENVAQTKPTYSVQIPENEPMSMIVTLTAGTHNLIMNVINSTGRWQIESYKYNDEFYHPIESEAYGYSWHWSFGCKNLTLQAPLPPPYQGKRKIIRLTKFQFQPFWDEMNTAEMKFGPCNDCIGFFSAGIWGGLFVVILLLLILFYGISNMMEIRTMDRFDDPKGKTITISAQE